MKKLLLIAGLLWTAVASAQFVPGQVLTAAELNSQFALYAPLTGATYSGPVTIPTLTSTTVNTTNLNISGTFTLPASTVLPNGVTATTQGFLDNSTKVATTAFAKQTVLAATAEIPIANFTGGTYNFETAGTGGSLVVFVTGGVVASIPAVANPGSGYQVGDCLILVGGNGDAIARVTGVSGGGISSASVVYGGTAYTTGATLAGSPLPPGSRTANLNGVLTSNALVIIPQGTYLQGARRVGFQNNTTGAFTVQVKLSNGSGGSTGVGVFLPQGTANSTSTLLYTDGVSDVWPEVSGTIPGSVPLSSLASQAANTVVANTLGASASPTAAPIPSCSTASSSLQWTSGTGFACNSAINASTLGGVAAASYLTSATAASTYATIAQATTALAATGGTINGVNIGGTTAAAGNFTTLNASANDALMYNNNSAQSLTSGSATTITGWTKVYDRVNANFVASTGVFTAPQAGFYHVDVILTLASSTLVAGDAFTVAILANGTAEIEGFAAMQAAATAPFYVTASGVIQLALGQTITVQATQTSGATKTLSGTPIVNTISIHKIP